MAKQAVKVLLVQEQDGDESISRLLAVAEISAFDVNWVTTAVAGIGALEHEQFDVCLVDSQLADLDGVQFLREVRQRHVNTPLILLAGQGDYRIDLEAMRAGASDFLVKAQLTPEALERSIRYAVDRFTTSREIQRTHGELQASELRFRSVVQTANDAIVLADSEARIIFWNKGAEQIFGYAEDEILSSQIELLLAERYRSTYQVAFERFRLTGKSNIVGKTVELEGLRQDGSDFPLELSLASWSTNEGTFFTAIIRDLTERRRTDELRLAKEAAETANLAKSSFVAKMSHDLRTPLSAIIGFAQILLQNRDGHLGPQDIDFLQRILMNAKDQLNLINTLLDISKIEAGRMDLTMSDVSIDSLVRETVKQMESRKGKQVSLGVDVPDGLHSMSTDEVKLKQVLMNLIDNALKVTEQGSVVVRVHGNVADRRPVRIDVIDTGPGIPEDEIHEIFEPFQQAPVEGAEPPAGTGLGLTISRSLCELMGYQLLAQNGPDGGSTFSIVLDGEVQRMPMPAA